MTKLLIGVAVGSVAAYAVALWAVGRALEFDWNLR